jgi:hypothetical protein
VSGGFYTVLTTPGERGVVPGSRVDTLKEIMFSGFSQSLELFWGAACARYSKGSHDVAAVLACHFVEERIYHRAAE